MLRGTSWEAEAWLGCGLCCVDKYRLQLKAEIKTGIDSDALEKGVLDWGSRRHWGQKACAYVLLFVRVCT